MTGDALQGDDVTLATLYRRKYYQNGTHAGYILYMTDAAQSSSDIEQMRKAMRDTKGVGNFRNLFYVCAQRKAGRD